MTVHALRDMFTSVVVAKDPRAIPRHYHPDFELCTNGHVQSFEDFDRGHRAVYATDVEYAIEYDELAWVQSGSRVAGRLWVTLTEPDAAATRIEVVFIAHYLDGRIHRLWELTWPDWSSMALFGSY